MSRVMAILDARLINEPKVSEPQRSSINALASLAASAANKGKGSPPTR